MTSTIIFITGANRGLGLGLLQKYLNKPNHTIIAGNRDPAHPSSQALADLPKAEGSKLIVVKLDASVDGDAFSAVKELQGHHGIDHLDIVIANAGVSYAWPPVADLKLDDFRGHMAPNVYGFIALYQATRELLRKSSREPIFAPIGSIAGCITNQPPIPNAAYGPTKTLVNWFTVRINAEDPWLNAFVMSPGWVQTDLGNAGARHFGLKQAEITIEDSVAGMIKIFEGANKETVGGKLVSFDGAVLGY